MVLILGKNETFIGGLTVNLHISTNFQVKFHEPMNAIKIACKKDWGMLWLHTNPN